jgi:hypothetical protein
MFPAARNGQYFNRSDGRFVATKLPTDINVSTRARRAVFL